ncbi:MAG: type II toxin-antitoxin system RelE/ParE family toxin [Bauldia sp.]|nr:MAG: type II toxin-antitoxin system RelE/ParE family toxin [Bauldia sp.]
MPRYVIAPAAAADIESILAWSHEHFGVEARVRYEALIVQGILDVASSPDRAGVHKRPEIADDARTYHLYASCRRVTAATGRVKEPRHFLLFRTRADGAIEIGRVLHDSMDLAIHLPEEYRSPATGGEDPEADR